MLIEILGLSGKKTAPKVSGAGRGEPAQRRFGGSSQSKSLNPKTAKRRLLRDPEGEPKYGRPVHQRQEAWVASGALGHAGVELGENGSVTPTSSRAERLVAPKRRSLGTVSPRPRLLFATSPRTNRQSKGWTHTASKKRKHRNRQTQKMKKPRTGGSGASRVPWGEPVMAWAPSHYSLRLLRLSVSGILSHKAALKPISRNVSLL